MTHPNGSELVKPDELNVPQSDDRQYRRLGILVLIFLVGVFGIWAVFAPLESAVPAPGKVIVASNNRIIQHLNGGIVAEILVEDGKTVKKGEKLIGLETTQDAAQLQIVEAQYRESLALETRLLAERDGLGSVSFPAELEGFGLITEGQRREFNARSQQLADEKRVFMERIEQMRNQISGLESIIASKSALSKSYDEEIREWEVLYKEQLIDKMRLRDIKRQKVQTDGEIANAKAEISRVRAQINEINAQIIAQRQSFVKEVVAELRDVQTKLADLRARRAALKDVLARTDITSPVEGTVTNLSIHTVGGVITAGKPILEVVPANEPLIIEGRVAATEINNVHIGLRADIMFPSFAHIKSLNEVKGEVVHIAPDAIADEQTQALFYPVKIKVTPEGEKELARNHLSLHPGIPADAMIVVASRTVADYLIHPLKAMFQKSFNEQ